MKVKDYSYETFPEYTKPVKGMIELEGNRNNLRVRLKDIVYKDQLRIRLLYPNTILDESRKYPVVFHVQGSGWYKQDMDDHIFDMMPIVKAGYAYAIIEHTPSTESVFPRQVYDVKTAIRYLYKHADEYSIDINTIFLSGDSSGGHNALLTLFTYESHLLDDSNQQLPELKGMIDLYGVYDLTKIDEWYSKYDWKEEKNVSDLLGENPDKKTLLEASPAFYLKEGMHLPPMIILHGSKDHVIPFTQSVALYEKMKSLNYEVTLYRVNHADHGRSIFYVEDVYSTIIEFLNKNI